MLRQTQKKYRKSEIAQYHQLYKKTEDLLDVQVITGNLIKILAVLLSLLDLMPSTSKRNKTKQIKQKEWEWGNLQQESFELLKEKLSSSPILSYPNYSKPFEIHTDASGQGLEQYRIKNNQESKRLLRMLVEV